MELLYHIILVMPIDEYDIFLTINCGFFLHFDYYAQKIEALASIFVFCFMQFDCLNTIISGGINEFL